MSGRGVVVAAILFVVIGFVTIRQPEDFVKFIVGACVGAVVVAIIFFILGFGGQHDEDG